MPRGLGDTISGTWSGTFIIYNSDGTISHNQVVMRLAVTGPGVTGSIGPNIDRQSAFADGRLDGQSVTFHLPKPPITEYQLRLDHGHLRGTAHGTGATESVHADIDVEPAPALMPHAELLAEIREADRGMFDAYEACDVARYGTFQSDDLEFYQDNIGVRDKGQILAAMTNRCKEGIHLRRRLDDSTLVVNVVPGFDAVEAGTHRIYAVSADGSEHLEATVQFNHIWTKKSGKWQVLRAVSFDHR